MGVFHLAGSRVRVVDPIGKGIVTIDTVVLDVDGTLVDSVYARTIAWKAAFREVGVEVPSHRIHRAIGMGGDRVVSHLAGDSAEQGVGDELRRRHAEYFERLIPDDHAPPRAPPSCSPCCASAACTWWSPAPANPS